MNFIHLDDWAAERGISKRTAQRWAKEKTIPAKKQAIAKMVLKRFFGYVIDKDAPVPDLSTRSK